jgi:hypothetical protein
MARDLPAATRVLMACGAALTVLACGGSAHAPSASATPTPSPTATAPSPTPSPTADTESIQVVETGVGNYMLVAEPIAVLRNVASEHTAMGVVVDFTVHSPSGTYSLDSSPDVVLFPGQILAVGVICNRSCIDATSTQVTVSVGSWVLGGGLPLAVTSSAYACVSQNGYMGCTPTGGDSQGTVSATVSGTVQPFAELELTAFCRDAAGTIVDGGTTSTVWPGGASATMAVPVVGSPQPAVCAMFATVV